MFIFCALPRDVWHMRVLEEHAHNMKFPPSQPKKICHPFDFILGLAAMWKGKARRGKAEKISQPLALRQILEANGEALQSTNSLQCADTAKAPPKTAQQRERTQIKQRKNWSQLTRQGLSTFNTPLPPPRRRKEDHPWRLRRRIAWMKPGDMQQSLPAVAARISKSNEGGAYPPENFVLNAHVDARVRAHQAGRRQTESKHLSR